MTDEEVDKFVKEMGSFEFPDYDSIPFIPSMEWQFVPEGIVLPPGGEYRMRIEAGQKEARWDNPPPPETVIDNRKKQKEAEASQNGATQNETQEPKSEINEEAERAIAFSASTTQGSELLEINIPPRQVIIEDWFKEGDLGFVFAYRGTGKTWWVLGLCVALAESGSLGPWKASGQWPTLYVDGEMPHEDDKTRLLGLNGTVPDKLYVLNHEVLFHQKGLVMNLASRTDQEVILKLCLEKEIKVLVLDNLGCLFSGVAENDADEWGKILPWLLDLRRRRIAVIIVHHTGHDQSRMRGTVKREDTAQWVIRLDDKREDFSEAGADFISRFRKYRGKKLVLDYEWIFEPCGENAVLVTYKEASRADLILQWVSDGLTRCDDIAKELGVTKGTVSKLTTKLIKEGRLVKGPRGQGYALP